MNRDSGPFSKIQGRYLVFAWLIPWFYLPADIVIFDALKLPATWYWWDVYSYYYGHLIFGIAILLLGYYGRLSWPSLFGNSPTASELWPSLKLTFFIFLFSIASTYALFIPLSWIIPDFVQWWYLDTIYLIYWEGDSYPIPPNFLNFISLVVAAPILEEIAFRGILFHRWTRKWGLIMAMILSSALFACLHTDPIGAFAFGIGMCILYARTQSLWIPIICHAAYNFIAWLIDLSYNISYGPGDLYTIEDMQSEWYIGLICGVIVTLWLTLYFRSRLNSKEWRLPVILNR